MNIMVYDVAAENGGAATILKMYYHKHCNDKNNHYYYLLSTFVLEETDNITVINVPNIKKGWGNRLLFDVFGVKKYLKKYKIDMVLSLQNIIIPFYNGKQIVYEHNALPFSEYRFSIFEDKLMWIYQNIIGLLMKKSIKKADSVIVQTEWMKEAIVEQVRVPHSKILVEFPEVYIPSGYHYEINSSNSFFYPANGAKFKNHRLIVEACKVLKQSGINDFSVSFTLNGDENEEIAELFRLSKCLNLPVKWLGTLSTDEMFSLYRTSVLVFPSYIETIGLPIYEAKSIGCPLLLANCRYAKSLVSDYKNTSYFDYHSADELAKLMRDYIN